MVRIRSGRWYSGENQKELRRIAPSNANGTRRLISLIFLLALVLVLMGKVSDPKVMRKAFQSLGIQLDQEIVDQTPGQSQPPDSSQTVSNSNPDSVSIDEFVQANSQPGSPWDRTCEDLIPRLLSGASSQQVDQLAEYWFSPKAARIPSTKPQELLELDSVKLVEQFSQQFDKTSDNSVSWIGALDQFSARWQKVMQEANAFGQGESDEIPFAAKLPRDEFHLHLSANLDRMLLKNLRDASPWSAGEMVGFGRLLQRAKEFRYGQTDPPLVATKQLEGEFQKRRGSWVRFRGTVRLVEPIQREQPLVDQSSYSVLWLRGIDGSTQPIAAYTTSHMANQIKLSISETNYPEIEIIGLVGKKLAYGSVSGVEVTPTLFVGSIVQYAAPESPLLAQSNEAVSRQLGITGVAAFLLSLVAAIFVWKQLRPQDHPRKIGDSIKLLVGFTWLMVSLDASHCSAQAPPWKETQSPAGIKSQVVQQRLESAFDENQTRQIQQLLEGNETIVPDSILRAMFALNQVGWESIWKPGKPLPLATGHQLVPAQLSGWAWSVQPLALNASQQEWFSLSPTQNIYRIQIQTVEMKDQQPPLLVSVFCRDVPKAWKESAQLKQPVQLQGFGCLAGGQTSPWFYLAEQVSWKLGESDIRNSTELHPAIPAGWLELAKFGFDLAWLDLLAANNQKRLSMAETGPLMKMLDIARQHPSTETATVLPIESMRNPIEHLASPIDWQVRLVSGSMVETKHEGRAIKYYQLDGFAKIPHQTVNYTIPDTGQSLTFKNEFPVTIVTQADSEFIPFDQLNRGEQTWQIGKTAQVRGRFLRLWSYESQRLSTPEASNRQVAPLIVAGQLTESNLLPEVRPTSLWSVAVVAGMMLVGMFWVLKNFLKKSTRPARR